MTKTKKLLYVLLSVIMLIATACYFVGCDKTDDGNNTIDVTAKVVATRSGTQIGEWVFDPYVFEKSATYEYTGEEISIGVLQYRYDPTPLIPSNYDGRWCSTDSASVVGFSKDVLYSDVNGTQDVSVTKIIERGTYIVTFRLVNRWNNPDYSEIYTKRRFKVTITIS